MRFTSLIEKEAEKAERLLESALGIKCKKVFEESHLEISVPLPAANLKDKAVEAQQPKKLSAGDVIDLVVNNEVEEAQQLKKRSLRMLLIR